MNMKLNTTQKRVVESFEAPSKEHSQKMMNATYDKQTMKWKKQLRNMNLLDNIVKNVQMKKYQ